MPATFSWKGLEMQPFNFRKWIANLGRTDASTPARTVRRTQSPTRLDVSMLEDRTVPNTYTWQPTAGSNSWSNSANWFDNTTTQVDNYPSQPGDVANINGTFTGSQTITLDGAITVGTLNLGDAGNTYSSTITAGSAGSLTFSSGGSGSASLNFGTAPADTETIAAGVTLASNLNVATSSAGIGYISGSIGQASSAASINVSSSGTGTFGLSGANTYSGGTTLTSGYATPGTPTSFGTGTITFSGGSLSAIGSVGLTEGYINAGNVNNFNLDATDPNPANGVSPVYNFRTGETNSVYNTTNYSDPNYNPLSTTPWANNQTWVYTGEFYTADGTVAFAKNVDDDTQVVVDGVQYLNNTGWNSPITTGKLQLTPGWHEITVRFANGGGGAGAVGGDGWVGDTAANGGYGFGMATDQTPGWANITDTAVAGGGGFGENAGGASTDETNGGNYVNVFDNGSGSLFRTPSISLANPIVVSGGSGAPITVGAYTGLTLSGPVTDVGGVQLTGAGSLNITGAVSGSGGITEAGSGTLVLGGTDSYLGNTTVNSGTLVAGSAGAIGANSAVTLAQGTTLSLNGNSISIGSLGGFGTVQNGGSAAATLTMGALGSTTNFDGIVQNGGSGALALTVVGGNTTLNEPSTYSGPTLVTTGGILTAMNNTAFGTSVLTTTAGGQVVLGAYGTPGLTEGYIDNVYNNNGLDLTDPNPANGRSPVLNFRTGETSGVIQNNTGTPLSLSQPWASHQTWVYDGQFYTADGSVAFAANIDDGAELSIDGVTYFDNAYYGNQMTTGQLHLSPGWHTIEARFSNNAGGAGGFNSNNWTTNFGFGMSTDTTPGWSSIPAGETVGVGGNGILNAQGTWFNVGGSQVGPTDPGNGSLFRALGMTLANAFSEPSGSTANISVASGTTDTYSGSISGAGGLNVSGTGTLVLSGSNIYTGATTVVSGVLKIGAAHTIPSTSSVTVTSPGSLSLNGINQTYSNLTGTGTIQNASTTAATLTVSPASGVDDAFNGVLQNGTPATGTAASLSLVQAGAGTFEIDGTDTATWDHRQRRHPRRFGHGWVRDRQPGRHGRPWGGWGWHRHSDRRWLDIHTGYWHYKKQSEYRAQWQFHNQWQRARHQ